MNSTQSFFYIYLFKHFFKRFCHSSRDIVLKSNFSCSNRTINITINDDGEDYYINETFDYKLIKNAREENLLYKNLFSNYSILKMDSESNASYHNFKDNFIMNLLTYLPFISRAFVGTGNQYLSDSQFSIPVGLIMATIVDFVWCIFFLILFQNFKERIPK